MTASYKTLIKSYSLIIIHDCYSLFLYSSFDSVSDRMKNLVVYSYQPEGNVIIHWWWILILFFILNITELLIIKFNIFWIVKVHCLTIQLKQWLKLWHEKYRVVVFTRDCQFEIHFLARESHGGQRLIRKADFNAGSNVSSMFRVRCKLYDPSSDKRMTGAPEKRHITYFGR